MSWAGPAAARQGITVDEVILREMRRVAAQFGPRSILVPRKETEK